MPPPSAILLSAAVAPTHPTVSNCRPLAGRDAARMAVPGGYVRRILEAAGVPREDVRGFGSLRLLQVLLNIGEALDANDEALEIFFGGNAPDGCSARNPRLAALFINNDLRIADAHDVGENLQKIEALGFDSASINGGYGPA
jgi:hypothetical protein